jgi:hypothetical protein
MILSNIMSFKTLGGIERMFEPVNTFKTQLYIKPDAMYNTPFLNQTKTYRAIDRAFQKS